MNLKKLAQRANQLHDQVETQLRATVLIAKQCGEVLVEAKSKVKHGEWLDWLESNFAASHQTACAYMRIAKCWESHLAHLFDQPEYFEALPTVAYALKLIAKYKPSQMSSQADPVWNDPTDLQEIDKSFKHIMHVLTERVHELLDYDTLSDWHHQRAVLDAKRYNLPDGRTAIVLTTKRYTMDLDEDSWAVDEEDMLDAIESNENQEVAG